MTIKNPIQYDSIQEYGEHKISTWKVAPVTLNRELTRSAFQDILRDVVGEDWVHLDHETGEHRTETDYYVVQEKGYVYRIEHNRCGLERHGNNILFDDDVPAQIRWEIALGVFEYMLQRRREAGHWDEYDPDIFPWLEDQRAQAEDIEDLRDIVDEATERIRDAKQEVRGTDDE